MPQYASLADYWSASNQNAIDYGLRKSALGYGTPSAAQSNTATQLQDSGSWYQQPDGSFARTPFTVGQNSVGIPNYGGGGGAVGLQTGANDPSRNPLISGNGGGGTVGATVSSGGGGGGGGGSATYSLESFPGYSAIMQDISGVISPDVKNQLIQTAAERGISMGTPGAPVNDAALMRSIGLTSDALRSRGISELSPLYQQQVSEAGQTSRLGMSLAAQMAQLQVSEAGQDRRQAASIASQQALASLQEAGLDQRQAASIAADMQKLILSESAADRRQAADIAASMDRLQAGNASTYDLAKLEAETRVNLANISGQYGITQEQLRDATQRYISASGDAAAMARLKAELESRESISANQLAQQAQQNQFSNILGLYNAGLDTRKLNASIPQPIPGQVGQTGNMSDVVSVPLGNTGRYTTMPAADYARYQQSQQTNQVTNPYMNILNQLYGIQNSLQGSSLFAGA